VTVRDSGPGIPAEVVGRIWESYFTTKDRGTGLGLTIVKHTAEMYGGRVRVESEAGKGAAFTVTLPARTLMRLR
jgi:signal transduction histidine kinase